MNYLNVLRGGGARLIALLLVVALLGTAYGQDDMVQIVYWDQASGEEASQAAIGQIIANFEEANPGIEIVREVIDANVMRDIAKPTIEAGEGPDLIYYDTGPGYAGILARAGLLLPLDAAYAANNWDERLIPISRAWTTFDGQVYGVGHELEAQGFYWNKRIFAEEGLEPAATFAELLDLCRTFRERGYDTPLARGWAGNAFPIVHTWYNVLNNYIPESTMTAAVSGEHPWNDPEFVAALEFLANDIAGAGCFNEDAYAIDFLSSLDVFLTAQAPMRIDSTWPMQFFTDDVPDEFGFMVAPPIEDRPQAMIRLMGSGWFIPADTEHPEETINFLDYLVSEDAIPLWVEGAKLLPALAGVDYSGLDIRPVYRDFTNLVATWDGDIGYHLDVVIPSNVYLMMKETFPDLIAGRMTAQEVADRLEAESQKAIADGRYVDLTP